MPLRNAKQGFVRSIPIYKVQIKMTSITEMKLVLFTCMFTIAIAASFFLIAFLSSVFPNGAYKAVVWFLTLIFDANITSKYLRWIMLH
jgi:hypothetical protein